MVQQSEWKPVSEHHAPPKAVTAAAGLVKEISGPSQSKQLGATAATAEALRVIRGAKRLKSQGTQQERMEVARWGSCSDCLSRLCQLCSCPELS